MNNCIIKGSSFINIEIVSGREKNSISNLKLNISTKKYIHVVSDDLNAKREYLAIYLKRTKSSKIFSRFELILKKTELNLI
jgi:hypothetical protein